MRELRTMVDICSDKTILLLRSRIAARMAGIGCYGVMVVVRPLGEVVGKLQADDVGGGVLEVDDD